MVKIENGCVDCGLPCLGNSCPHRYEKHYYCDECGEEEEIYYFEDKELCIRCIIKKLEKVE